MRKIFAILMAAMLLALCACSATDTSASADQADSPQVQYEYQLTAGEATAVSDVTFDEMVTVTVDPASTRDGSIDLRSSINFYNCTFVGGLTIVGDYHAMVSLGDGCSFGDGSVITCKEATSGSAKDVTMEDNFVKV